MSTLKNLLHTILSLPFWESRRGLLSPLRGAGGVFLIFALLFSSCRKTVQPTEIFIYDPVRHYFPVVQGDELRLSYRVRNAGKDVLVFTDIQPACLAIERIDDSPSFLLPGDSCDLCFIFHSWQNIGNVEHIIRLFGNFENGEACLTFDVNVVRPTIDGSDYEEIYYRHQSEHERLVDGHRGEKGYYTDEDLAAAIADAVAISVTEAIKSENPTTFSK